MNEVDKAYELFRMMGQRLAVRFVTAKITHWEFDEFIPVRTETKAYWEQVLYFLLNSVV